MALHGMHGRRGVDPCGNPHFHSVLSGLGLNDAYASAALTDQPYRRVLARPTSDAAHGPARAYVLANARAVGRLQQAQEIQECGLRSEQVDQLIKLGEKYLAQGDVGTARRLLERASRARDARATLMLGATYDPDGLRRMGVVGIEPDLAQAHFWYTRALEFGCREASLRLMALAQLNR
jgi:TPR repeat protein